MTNQPTDTGATPEPTSRIGGFIDRGWARVDGAWTSMSDAIASRPIGRWWTAVERPNVADWALLGVVCLLAFVTFLYGDVRVTFEHSFNFLDALFSGRPQDFYQIAIENSTFGHPAVYDIPIYAVFGLWNLPTYVIAQVTGFDYLTSTPAQLWLKAMMVVFAIIAARVMFTIAKTLGMTAARAKWVAFYFLSSVSLFFPVFVIVQYDIISLTFMLLGVLAYMRGRTRSFLLWFLVATTFKPFALFIFIPLVLLREKRLLRVALQLIVGVAGLVLCRIPFRGNLPYEISTGGFTDLMFDRLSTSGFAWHSGIIVPLFIVFIVGLAIFAYAKRPSSQRELQAFAVYLSLAAFMVFCALVPLNPYWITLMAPFAVLIIFLNPRFLTLNSLLEVSIGTSILVSYMHVGYSMYNAGIFTELLFGQFIPPASPQRFSSPGEILTRLGFPPSDVVFLVGFMVACVIAVLVINYPRASFVAGMPNAEPIKRSVVWVRVGVLFGFCALLIAMYLIPGTPTLYSSVSNAPTRTEVDVLAPGSVVEEELEFDRSLDVSAIQVGLDASGGNWMNFATVKVTVLDAAGTSVFEGTSAANVIGVGLVPFRVDGLILEANEAYTLQVSGFDYVDQPVFVQINPDQDTFPTTENGREVDGDIVMVILGTESE